MSRRKTTLKYRKERAVLSDMLPYEVPVSFSNRHFYNFLLRHKIEFNENILSWHAHNDTLDMCIRILFGIDNATPIQTETVQMHDKPVTRKTCHFNLKGSKLSTASIPFAYKISHKQNEYRELVVPHPRNQLQMVDLYNKCKELILYYCSGSPFSIRRPKKISSYIYHKDKTHYENLANSNYDIEEHNKEYESLRSFFVYKDYSNVYKFYESYKYHRCEKKYNQLVKLDISKCFDSIYTHSLAWALLGKESVKEDLRKVHQTFAGRFDQLMQHINYRETNGIVIGPEFSRIFAELILQHVDQNVRGRLHKKYALTHKVHYEIFRYVDDYFIFFNDEPTKERILEILQLTLKEFKLYLNPAKAISYEKPIITEISRAKQRIASLLNEKLVYSLEDTEDLDENGKKIARGNISINSKSLIIKFKTILKECEVEYKDMLNYSLAIVESRCDRIIKSYQKTRKEYRSEKQLLAAILNILEFVFFVYSVSPRVNTTIKLCRILRIFTSVMKDKDFNKDFKHVVFKYIHDDVRFVLKKNKNSEHIQVETLYLLVALSELGREYWLEEKVLADYFNIKLNDAGDFEGSPDLNYFSITVLLFYMRDKKRYAKLRIFVESLIVAKFTARKNALYKDAELSMLMLDILACPYVAKATKTQLLVIHNVNDATMQNNLMNMKQADSAHLNQLWFTAWDRFDFGKALDAKHSQEVY